MAIRTESIVYGDFQAPAGTVLASVVVTFSDTAGNHVGQTIKPGDQPAPVDLAQGTWTAEAQAMDLMGNPVGTAAIDGPFTIGAPATVTVSIPASMTGTTA